MAATRLGLCVRALIGVDAGAEGAFELDVLRSAGVEVMLVGLRRGPVFENRKVRNGRSQLALQASDQLPTDAMPAHWRDSTAMLLVPVAGELSDEWAGVPPAGAFVGLAWQGLLRRLVPGRTVEPLELISRPLSSRADIAVVSAEDATAGGVAITELLTRPGQQLAVTHGPLGAVVVERGGDGAPAITARHVPAVRAANPVDQTGAGDVFLAAWCAARLLAPAADRWRHMAVAAAAGSATVETDRFDGLPDARALRDRLLRRPARGAAVDRPARPDALAGSARAERHQRRAHGG